MKLQITLNKEREELLARLMEGSYLSRSAFIISLLAQEEKRRLDERNKKPVGRPRKEEEVDEMPDENEPRTKTVPKHLEAYVFPLHAGRPVNDYDIVMLEEKKKMHDAQSGKA